MFKTKSFQKISFQVIVHSVRFYLNVLARIAPSRAGEQAFNLFSKPRKGRLTESDKMYLATAQALDLASRDTPFKAYYWQGSGETILLAHGWESNSARWKPLVQKLQAKGFAVVALDAPAHGASGGSIFVPTHYADCMRVVSEKYPPSVVVGHSVGGYAAAYFLAYWADKKTKPVRKLILLASPSSLNQIFDAYIRAIGLSPQLRKVFYQFIHKKYGKPADDFAAEHFMHLIEAEGLIIHDADDDVIGYADAPLLQSKWRNARLLTTQGLGHRLRHESVYQAIVDFM